MAALFATAATSTSPLLLSGVRLLLRGQGARETVRRSAGCKPAPDRSPRPTSSPYSSVNPRSGLDQPRKEEQGEDQTHNHRWIGWVQPWDGQISQLHHGCDQHLKQSRLLRCCQQQQTANPFLPDELGFVQLFLSGPGARPRHWLLTPNFVRTRLI